MERPKMSPDNTYTSDRIGLNWMEIGAGRRDGGLHHEQMIFLRDALIAMIPYGTGGRGFVASLREDRSRDDVCKLLKLESRRNDISESLAHFLRKTGQSLVAHGEAWFEIVTYSNDRDQFRVLEPLPAGRFVRLAGHVAQVKNSTSPRRWPVLGPWIPADKVIRFRFPRTFGSPSRHRRMLRSLERLSRVMPSFFLEDVQRARSEVGFDFDRYRRLIDAEKSRTIREWGLPHFMRPQERDITGYVSIYGGLVHRKAQAEVLEHLVSEVNSLLLRFGLPQINVAGVPTSDEITEAIQKLERGEIDFAEANSVIY